MAHATAALLSMGDELTLGQRLNTNSRWLSERLVDAGITPVEHVTVPDDLDATVGTLQRLAGGVDLVISTGGLGPTADDLCREALARAANDTLVEDAQALAQITAWYGTRGRPMPEVNRVQALRPSRASILPNSRGTAPGLAARIGGCDVFCLPGPPGEMAAMFDAHVVPRLVPPIGRVVLTRAFHCFGIAESDLAVRLGRLMDRSRRTLVGTTASGGVVSIRIRYEGPAEASEREMEETSRAALAAAGPHCFGRDGVSLAEAVLSELRGRARTLAVVESCTGGLLGSMLTEVPGSSAVFIGGWVTYANELKVALGVPRETIGAHGAVSRQTAEAMARAGLAACSADYALAITGIAGPDGGTPEKPVGTVWISLAARNGEECAFESRRFALAGGDRTGVREWAARSAMMMLVLHLRGTSASPLLRQAEEHRTP